MRYRYDPPANGADFELLCLRLLQEEWKLPQLQLYGHLGDPQEGIDIFDSVGTPPSRAAQCKLHDRGKSIPPTEIRKEVSKVRKSSQKITEYYILTTAKKSKKVQDEVLRINKEHQEEGLFRVEVLAWEDLEVLLNSHPEVRQEFYESVPGYVAAVLKTKLADLESKLDQIGEKIELPSLPLIRSRIEVEHLDTAVPFTAEIGALAGSETPAVVSEATLRQLALLIGKNRLVVILGDVLDASVALPQALLGQSLSQKAGLEHTDLYLAGSRIEERHGRTELVDVARRELQGVNGSPTLPYQSLAALPISTIVSLYPDPVLEKLLVTQEHGFRSIVADDDLVVFDLEPGRKELFLLGGSARFNTGLLLTQKDHEGLIERTTHLARGLRDRLALRDILLLGCNLMDRKFKKLFYWLTRHRTRKEGLLFVSGPAMLDEFWMSWNTILLNENPANLLIRLSAYASSLDPITAEEPISVTVTAQAPYKYLDYYETEDKPLFFGRDEEVRRFAREILSAQRRVTVLCGRSGVGKTSLVKAGLIPFLEGGGEIITAYARCDQDTERAIVDRVRARSSCSKPINHESPTHLASALRECYANDPRLQIIFIDQTEEVFIKLGRHELDSLASALEECLSDPDGVTRFVFIIREDFLSRMAILGEKLASVLSSSCRLDDLSWDAAHSVILKPATLCGVRVEEGLADAILADLSPDKVLPAHLQIVCDRVFCACEDEKVMTLLTYQELGRASLILRNHLEQAMTRISPGLEPAARSVLAALVTSERTKVPLPLDEIAARAGLDLETASNANHDLIHRCRLVREVLGKVGFFELSHESLAESISVWLSEIQARTRAVQELLDREVSSSRKLAEYVIKRDRLRLIDENSESLYLNHDALKLVVASYAVQRDIPEFWRSKLQTLAPEDAWEALFIRPVRANPFVLEELLLDRDLLRISLGSRGGLPLDIESRLEEWCRRSDSETIYQVIPLLNRFETLRFGEALLQRLVDFPRDEIKRIIRLVSDHLIINLVEAVDAAVKGSRSWGALPAIVATLLEAADVRSATARMRPQLLHALRVLLRSPSREQADLANAEYARFVIAEYNAGIPLVGVEDIDKVAIIPIVLGAEDDLADAGISFLLATRSYDHLESLLCSMERLSKPRRAVLESNLREAGNFGAEVVARALAKTTPNEPLLEFGCSLFSDYWRAYPLGPNALMLRDGLLDILERISGNHTLLIARSFQALQATDLAEAFIARLPAVNSETALEMLKLSWPDWGWLAAAVASRFQDQRVHREVASQCRGRISEISTRAIIAIIRQGGLIAWDTAKALACAMDEFERPPQEIEAILTVLRESKVELGTAQYIIILWLRIQLCDVSINYATVQLAILSILCTDQRSRLRELDNIEICLVLKAVDYWLTRAGGFSAVEPMVRRQALDALRDLRSRSEDSDRTLGKLFASDPAAGAYLWHGSLAEQEGFIDQLLLSPATPGEGVIKLLRQFSANGHVIVRAKAAYALAYWGNPAGFKAAVFLLGRRGRNKILKPALDICATAVREYAKHLSEADISSVLLEETVAHLVLPELLESRGTMLLANTELLGLVLKALSQLPWSEARELRLKFVQLPPELVEALSAVAARGDSKQRYQAEQILKVRKEHERGCKHQGT